MSRPKKGLPARALLTGGIHRPIGPDHPFAPARDVNRDGLGDRRGLAIEEVPEELQPKSYKPGTLEVIRKSARLWAVYLDGRKIGTRPTWQDAMDLGTDRMLGVWS